MGTFNKNIEIHIKITVSVKFVFLFLTSLVENGKAKVSSVGRISKYEGCSKISWTHVISFQITTL